MHDNKKPINTLDKAALIHDIEYYKGNQFKADNNMFKNIVKHNPMMLPYASLIRAGFLIKDVVGYDVPVNDSQYKHLKELAINKGYASEDDFY